MAPSSFTDVRGRSRIGFASRAAAGVTALALVIIPLAYAAGTPTFAGPTIKNPRVPPEFQLRDQAGRIVDLAKQRGRVVLLTFLYTHCVDVCPLTAEHLQLALESLGRRRSDARVLAISVDPVGDTPSAVRHFIRVHRLGPQFHYLTGPRSTLRRIWTEYLVHSSSRTGGLVDHTLYTLLLDRSLKGRVLYDSTAKVSAIAHDLRILLGMR
jgi:protein SCO1/2